MKLIEPLIITYHTYHEGSRFILKESHWYTMKVSGNQTLTPQTEEDILEVKWITKEEAKQYFPECYPSVVDVLEKYIK